MTPQQLQAEIENKVTLSAEEAAEAKALEGKQRGLQMQQADLQQAMNALYGEIATGRQAWWRKVIKAHGLTEKTKELVYGIEWSEENPDTAFLVVADILTPQAAPGEPEQAFLDQVTAEPPPEAAVRLVEVPDLPEA